jgi:hypothetical protein
MQRNRRIIAIASGALALAFVVVTSAGAVVLDPSSQKDLVKHRKDIGKQTTKMALCLAKSAIKCEKGGATSASECNLADPASSTHPNPKNVEKFIAAVDKCEGKLNLTKKGPASDYSLIGCPGDSDPGTPGDQPYTDLTDYQAGVPATTAAQLNLLTPVIDSQCGGPASTDPAVIDCVAEQAAALLKYAKGVFKCEAKCEEDYKGGKGLGGPTDSDTQCNPSSGSADPDFANCVSAALAKVQKKVTLFPIEVTAVNAAIGTASNDLYNQNDCP